MITDPFDVTFVVTAVLFNLLIAAIFVAARGRRARMLRAVGIAWLLLAFPLAVVFLHDLTSGEPLWVLLCFAGVLLYMVVELLLEHVLKIEFRNRLVLHVPYIVLEYVALFGLIGIAFSIGQAAGYIVSISFWVLMACLIYLYSGPGRKRQRKLS